MRPVTEPEAKPKVLKFAPVKLLVIESQVEYYRIVSFAIGVGLAHIFIGATTMVALMYSLQTKDVHVGLCTFGYQLLSGEAILSLNYMNGWSEHLRSKHRRFAHILLHICGICCVTSGVVSIMSGKRPSWTGHCSTAVAALVLTFLGIVTGPIGLHDVTHIKVIHSGLGLSIYAMSSICVCFGFYTSEFKQWTNSVMIYILTALVLSYTICICVVTIVHGVLTIK